MAFAFIGGAFAARQQLAQPAVGLAIARIDQDIRRAIDEDEPRTDQQSRFTLDLVVGQLVKRAHHAGQRVAIGDADRRELQFASLMHVLLRM